jgi:hypothetical protein
MRAFLESSLLQFFHQNLVKNSKKSTSTNSIIFLFKLLSEFYSKFGSQIS